MRAWIVLIAIAIAIAACGKSSPSPSSDCASVLRAHYQPAIEDIRDSIDPPEQRAPIAQIEKLRDGLIERCTADHWSSEVLSCIAHASDLTPCYRRLDVMQFAKVQPVRDGPAHEAMTTIRAFRDKMCACADRACADHVSEAMTTWAMEHRNDAPEKPSDEMSKQMSDVTQQFSKCLTKLMMGDTGSAAQ